MIFEGLATTSEEEDLQPITGDFCMDGAIGANMPEGIPDLWKKAFNEHDAQDALKEFTKIQDSESRFELGPVDQPDKPATPAPAIKGTPRFPGHLTIPRTTVVQPLKGESSPGIVTETSGQRGQLTPFPQLFSGGGLRRKSISSYKPMGEYEDSPLKRRVFPTEDDSTSGSDDDDATQKPDAPNRHIRGKPPTSIEEERLASLLGQIKIEEEKLASLRDKVKQEERTKAAVEEETQRLKQEHNRMAAEAARMEEQRVLKETQNRLEEQARAESERARQAEEIHHIKARLQEAEAARLEADKELRSMIKRTKENQEQDVREQEEARLKEAKRLQGQEEAARQRQIQELDDARTAARLQQEEEEQFRRVPRKRVDSEHDKRAAKDLQDTEENRTHEEDDEMMVARVRKELRALLCDMDPNDQLEAEARQKAQAAAYEKQMAAYSNQTSESITQKARLQYAYDLVAEARARFQKNSATTTHHTVPHTTQNDAYSYRNIESVPSKFQQQPPAMSNGEPVHTTRLSGDRPLYPHYNAHQQPLAPVWFEEAGLHDQNQLFVGTHQQPIASAHQQGAAFFEQPHSNGNVSGYNLEPPLAHQPKQGPAPFYPYDNSPALQPSSARLPRDQVQTSRGYVSPPAQRTSAHAAGHVYEQAHPISSAGHDLQKSTPSAASYLSLSSTASDDVSYISDTSAPEVLTGDLMPPYESDSKAVRYGNGNRACWSVSEAPYPLLPVHIQVDDAESGHLHFHTDTLYSRSFVWMLSLSGKWDDVTEQWRTDWGLNSEKDMLEHPRYHGLVLTVSPDNKPNWIQFGTFKNKLKDGTAKKAKTSARGLVLFPPK